MSYLEDMNYVEDKSSGGPEGTNELHLWYINLMTVIIIINAYHNMHKTNLIRILFREKLLLDSTVEFKSLKVKTVWPPISSFTLQFQVVFDMS